MPRERLISRISITRCGRDFAFADVVCDEGWSIPSIRVRLADQAVDWPRRKSKAAEAAIPELEHVASLAGADQSSTPLVSPPRRSAIGSTGRSWSTACS
jgi:hypothetical protein